MNRSKVLVVAPQPFYTDRGTPIAIRHVIRALTEGGYEVDVVTFPLGRDLQLNGVRFFRCANPLRIRHVPIGFSLGKLLLDPFLVAEMWKRLRAEHYALIHAVEEAAFAAALLGRRFQVPVLYDMQSSLPEQLTRHAVFRSRPVQALLRRCEAWLLRRVDLTVCSAGLAARVQRVEPHCRVAEWRYPSVLSLPTAAEVASVRDRLGIASDRRVVLYCGTFESYQNLGKLLHALPRVQAEVPGTVLVLVGADGAAARTVGEQVAAIGLGASVRIVERQPQERIPAYLAAADVLVSLRAFGGNLPLKIFDYLAAGKPIVATPNGADPALLTPDRAVLVAGDTDELACAIATLLKDGPRAERLAGNARAYAEANLGWSRFTESVTSYVREASARSAAQAVVSA